MRGNGCFGFSYEQQDEIWAKCKNGDNPANQDAAANDEMLDQALRQH